MSRAIFISHKNTNISDAIAAEISAAVKTADHTCFNDGDSLKAGNDWNDDIRNSLRESDVVIIVLENGTEASNWVQREIDTAKAHGISLLPVVFGNYDDVKKSLERFEISTTQYVEYPFDDTGKQAARQKILDQIEPLSEKTLDNQTQYFNRWKLRRSSDVVKKTRGKGVPNQVTLSHPHTDIHFQIACGDASRMKGYDILVNTENNYMQMARFYETNTLSCAIRKSGANFRNGRLKQDTIQEELFQFAAANGGLPAAEASVFITSAGHEDSDMRDPNITDYRYIFHVAAVRIDVGNRTIEPFSNIAGFMSESILAIRDLERADGGIEKIDGSYIIKPSDDFKPIESILFPVFGAGNGGKTFEDAIGEIVARFSQDLIAAVKQRGLKNLKTVGIAIFFEEDVEDVKQVFLSNGFTEITDA